MENVDATNINNNNVTSNNLQIAYFISLSRLRTNKTETAANVGEPTTSFTAIPLYVITKCTVCKMLTNIHL